MISNLGRLDLTLRDAGIPIDGVGGVEGDVRVDYQPEATAEQRVQGAAIVADFDWSPEAAATYQAQIEKTEATSAVDDAFQQKGNRVERIVMSVATSAVKIINNDRAFLFNGMNGAVQAATSLADLKTRWAALSWPQPITNQQLINSIKADIAATPE